MNKITYLNSNPHLCPSNILDPAARQMELVQAAGRLFSATNGFATAKIGKQPSCNASKEYRSCPTKFLAEILFP